MELWLQIVGCTSSNGETSVVYYGVQPTKLDLKLDNSVNNNQVHNVVNVQ